MSNSYTLFCAELPDLSEEEVVWFRQQLEIVYVYGGVELTADTLPDGEDPDWPVNAAYAGPRFFHDGYEGEYEPFDAEFVEEDGKTSLVFSTEESGTPWAVCVLVQEFLRQFRPKGFWVLEWCAYSDKLWLGSCGGGTLIVTAMEIHDSLEWCQRVITELSDDNTMLN